MTKIVVTHDLGLSHEEVERLKTLGDVTVYNDRPSSPEEFLERSRGADVICSGIPGLREKHQDLHDVFISLPFVGVDFLDKDILKKNNVVVANSPGGNKYAVSEWVVGMIINLLRDLPHYTNVRELPKNKIPAPALGLPGKKVLVVGSGNIGKQVGLVCKALGMEVTYFNRGDNLANLSGDVDVIANCLSLNTSTRHIIDDKFFSSFKKGSYFVSVTHKSVYDSDALFKALDNGTLSGAAIDDGAMNVANTEDEYYKKLAEHPKILATPHIAFNTDVSDRTCNKIMIDNIESWLKGEALNVI